MKVSSARTRFWMAGPGVRAPYQVGRGGLEVEGVAEFREKPADDVHGFDAASNIEVVAGERRADRRKGVERSHEVLLAAQAVEWMGSI